MYNGKPLIYTLIEMYTRSPQFKDCVRVFADYGLEFDDKALLSVLLDDAASLQDEVKRHPSILFNRYNLIVLTHE